jgi:lactate permease
LTFIAALPIGLALLLLVGLRLPAKVAMPVCAFITVLAAYGLWQVPLLHITAAIVEALWVTASILLIVFGALFFLALLRWTGAIAVLQRSVGALSGDIRIQAVLVGWTFGSFLEGGAGFGTPAAITAPLLIGLGFRPLQAVVVALVGDSTAVSFGAVGTPMIIGMGKGLGSIADAPAVSDIALRIATFDLLLGTLMPVVVVVTLVLSSEGLSGWRRSIPAFPFAMAVGFAQAVTSWLVVASLGPEFPSLIGPLAGFLLAILLIRLQWLIPREQWSIQAQEEAKTSSFLSERQAEPSVIAAVAPYLLLLILLVLTRTQALPFGALLSGVTVGMSDLFGTGISAQLQPLYSPGAIFVLCTLVSALFLRAGWRGLGKSALTAGHVTLQTALALIAAIITVRIFLQSGVNNAGLESMPLVLADALARNLGGGWPAIAPWVGALGSFVSGSATFSNLLFALLQFQIATELGYAPISILALQSIGSAAGNMTCIHNVVAACAIGGILGQEGTVIRRTALPMFFYLLVAGLLGWLFSAG